jgi:hypothetical protein
VAEQDLTKERTSVVESGVADPAPLGLAAFALTTFAFSVTNAGFLGEEAINHFVPLALIYGGLGQFVAGMWEFLDRPGNLGDICEAAGDSRGAGADCAGLDIHSLGHLHPLHVDRILGRQRGTGYSVHAASGHFHPAGRHRVYPFDGAAPNSRLGGYRHGNIRLVRLGGGRAERHLRADDPARRACCRGRQLERRGAQVQR